MTPLKATYVSRTGTIVQMKAVEAELQKRGFALVADETRKKKLELKQYRRWQVDGANEPVVVLLWTEDERESRWPSMPVVDDPKSAIPIIRAGFSGR